MRHPFSAATAWAQLGALISVGTIWLSVLRVGPDGPDVHSWVALGIGVVVLATSSVCWGWLSGYRTAVEDAVHSGLTISVRRRDRDES